MHWLPALLPCNLIASIGADSKFRLWVEDPTLPVRSGRRFNSRARNTVFEVRAPARAPFLSFALKHDRHTRHTYLALLCRNAVMIVYQNEDPEEMSQWNKMDEFVVVDKPMRGEMASFKVRFDQNPEPCFAAIKAGVSRSALGIIVAGMYTARVWRTKDVEYVSAFGPGQNKEFYFAAELPGHSELVMDVAWAAGNTRGFDIVATVSQDGLVRVFEVSTPTNDEADDDADFRTRPETRMYPSDRRIVQSTQQNGTKSAPSGIGAGLAATANGRRKHEPLSPAGQVPHTVKEVARLAMHKGPVWRLKFDSAGQSLATSGDDGRVMMWRRLPDGGWLIAGELVIERDQPVPTLSRQPSARRLQGRTVGTSS